MSALARGDLREAAAVLGRLLDAIERGEIDAPTSYVARLEGARTALAALGAPGRAVRDGDPRGPAE